jgi:hypothetical protein
MSPAIVQHIRNDGPNPGATQLPNGLQTTGLRPFEPGNSVLAFTTCADYGGNHSATTLVDSEGNAYQQVRLITGDRSSLNTAQVLAMWFCPSVKGGPVPATFTQQFVGGDVDYQAFYALELAPCTVVGDNYYVQSAVAIAPNTVMSSALIPALPDDLLLGFCFNVSELSPVAVATPGDGMTLLENIWPFFEPQGANVCVATRVINSAGSYRAYFTPPAGVPDYWQTMGIVLRSAAAVVTPPVGLQLTAAQLAALSAPGGSLTIKGPN